MSYEDLADTIDLTKRDFSLLLVSPKTRLLDQLNSLWRSKGLAAYRLYVPEENSVLVIPNLDRFVTHRDFDEFLEKMKPNLLLVELRRLHATPEELGNSLTKETFDEYFDITVRDANAIYFLSDFKNN